MAMLPLELNINECYLELLLDESAAGLLNDKTFVLSNYQTKKEYCQGF